MTKGLACWFDAAAGVTADGHGAVQEWKDFSGHDHHARAGGGAAPLLVPVRLAPDQQSSSAKAGWPSTARFSPRNTTLSCDLPARLWSGAGGLLGRLKGRGSSYNTWGNDTGFWQDQFPAAVTRNGISLPGPAFDCSPLTRFMVLKIIVNAFNETDAAYAIGNNDGLADCDFDLAEILGYRSMLSPADEARVGGYLAAKYGIAAAYPPLPSPAAGAAAFPPGAMAAVKYQIVAAFGLALFAHDAGRGRPAGNRRGRALPRCSCGSTRTGSTSARQSPAARTSALPLATACRWPIRSTSGTLQQGAQPSGSAYRQSKAMARQEIKVYLGNADAESESSGPAVFNRSNRYLSVWR